MSFTAVAQTILEDAQALDSYISTNSLPSPSLGANGPYRTPLTTPEANKAHSNLLANTHKLSLLAQGPIASWTGVVYGGAGDAMTATAIYKFNIADHVPLSGEARFEDVAQKCGMALRDFKIVVRYAMTNFIFCEPRPGFIAHTASSKILAENKLVRSMMGMSSDEIFPALGKEIEALSKHPGSEEPTESSWALANHAQFPMFAELEVNHPARAATMAFAMESLALMFSDSIAINAYPWSTLPHPTSTIVDVGGGKGYFGLSLTPHFPHLNFIVQDLPATISAGLANCPPSLLESGQMKFTPHDFFTPQPSSLKGMADMYFFRAIFHNWPDKYCVQILRNLIPGLKRGARVLVMDVHTPDVGTMGAWQERMVRGSNLRMKIFFNAHDRESGEWPVLFAKADARFKVVRNEFVDREPGNSSGLTLAIVEAVWEGE